MIITNVETLRLKAHPNVLWVQLHTDSGLTGLGESWFGTAAVEADIHERIAPLIIGSNARRVEYLNTKMLPYTGFNGSGAEIRALSAVDVALWDLASKSVNLPLCEFLGGRFRNSIPVYNTCAGPNYVSQTSEVRPDNFGTGSDARTDNYEDLNAFMNSPEELAASLMEMGIESMKIWPFDFAEGAADGIDINHRDIEKAIAPFEKIRKAHGNKIRLKAELHGLWSLNAARKIALALEPLDIDWIEDPIWMDHTRDIAELASFTRTPLAGGETLAGIGDFSTLINDGNIATPIMDVTWGGGVTVARKVAALAEARARPVAFHDCSGPVTLMVSTHLALALRNIREQEITRAFYYGWYSELVDQLPPLTDGRITVTDKPGLGMNLQPDLLSRADAIHKVSSSETL